MQTVQRRHGTGLIARLLAEPWSFEFFQAVRLLNAHARNEPRRANALSGRIRFANSTALGFPPAEIESIRLDHTHSSGDRVANDPDFVLHTHFFGLTGGQGALPLHYTEQIIESEQQREDSATRSFYDLLTSRVVEQFYLAWRKHQLALMYEADPARQFAPLLLAFCGLGQEALRNRMIDDPGPIDDESLAYFAGLIFQRPLSAHAIQRIFTEYFNVEVRLVPFCGGWCSVPEGQYSRLGTASALLGKNVLLGERSWQRDLRVQIAIGPLSFNAYRAFLPGSSRMAALEKLLKFLTGYSLEYEVRLVLSAEAEKTIRLSESASSRLGMDGFLSTTDSQNERRDAAFTVLVAP